ncbi:hypothetical protein EYB26_002599 [Talaromyces marneffei]|uniref:uncharacterized protein n=1 Tax=Talaromyces marneffei TaxID=37727 RepID=UPI0012A8B9AA|nr:uncharacterized protein EYB26_002599 [Talaromyces marneffei]QGA14943.1 hypothetical protein EYB26_002599 [Talaromyces marneffei]
MSLSRPPLKPIPGNNQIVANKTASAKEDVRRFFKESYNVVISDMLSEIEHPFIIPIELYLSAREPTVSLKGLDLMSHDTYDIKTTFYTATFLDPVRAEIAALIECLLGDTTVLDASFDWAYVGGIEVMPTVFIEVPEGTVTDWAELESGIRGLLARGASKLGIVVDVQFRVKGDEIPLEIGLSLI